MLAQPAASSADVSWTAATDNGAPVNSYHLVLHDATNSQTTDLGTCSTCAHMVITNLDPTHTYTVAADAMSDAGEGPTASTSPFSPLATGTPATCPDGDGTCVVQDSTQTQTPMASFEDWSPIPPSSGSTPGSGIPAIPEGVPGTGDPSADTAGDPATDPQCALPLADRVGPSACFTDETTDATPTTAGITAVPDSYPGGGGGSSYTSNCNRLGCYIRYNDFQASFSGEIGFAYGSTLLGVVDIYVYWTLQGKQSWSKPVTMSIHTSQTIVQAHMIGDLLNGAPNKKNGGSQISGKRSQKNFGAGGGFYSWTPNGYRVSDNRNWDHNAVTEWAWTTSRYPGYWWVQVHSLVSHSNDKKTYRFDSVNSLTGNSYSSGYRR
jgi:hypothetical protein